MNKIFHGIRTANFFSNARMPSYYDKIDKPLLHQFYSMEEKIQRLYVKEMYDELQYKDRRSILKWCSNNQVGVFSDVGSNKLYVIKEEFETAKMKQANNYMREKYGSEKMEELPSSKNTIFEMNEEVNIDSEKDYNPLGEHERNFLHYLQNS